MAFCPECGKSAAAGATRCIHCNYEFPVAEKKAAPGRFKGTMMMAAPAVAKPAAAANANTAAAATAVTVPRGPVRVAAEPQPPTAPRLNVKATMIGAGIAPVVAKPAAAAPQIAASAAATPASPAARQDSHNDAKHIAMAQTQALFSPAETAAKPAAAAPMAVEPREPARYLPGDPMGPQPSAAMQSSPRLMLDDDSIAPPMKDRKWMLLAVGGVVLFSVLLLAFGLMH
jgi:hypothetical protein